MWLRAKARSSLKLELFVLHATTHGAGYDRRLPPRMRRKLRRAPYSAYSKYKMLSRRNARVSFAKPLQMALPGGDTLRLSARPAGRRYAIHAEIRRRKGKFYPVLRTHARPGELFFISGHRLRKGVVFVGVRVKAR